LSGGKTRLEGYWNALLGPAILLAPGRGNHTVEPAGIRISPPRHGTSHCR
jgi:hypothetical protein